MGQYSQIFVDTSKPLIAYAEKLLENVAGHNYARKPTWGLGGEVINCNHPAFVYGHLAMYPARIYTILGLDPKPVAPPPAFEELFPAGKECRDDPGANIYPDLEKVTSVFFKGMASSFDVIAKMNDADLLKPNPNERMRARFPTVGVTLNFLLTSHVAMHLGQISTWRRAMGLPAINL